MIKKIFLILSFLFIVSTIDSIYLNSFAAIKVNPDTIVRPVNKELFGIAFERIAREEWSTPLNFNDPALKNILKELAPTVVSIDNSLLGLPFYKESTGKKYSARISIIETLRRANITSDPIGAKLYNEAKKEPRYYGKPQHKNYDDVLQFIESLGDNVPVAIRIPIIFTNQRKETRNLKLNLTPKTGADLVEYLNGDQSTALGRLRAENGHPKPYNVKYFVLGNEFWSNHDYGGLSLSQITSQYNRFATAMKQADPTIKIGINLVDDAYPHEFFLPGISSQYSERIRYNDNVLKEVSNNIDFVTFHVYGGISEAASLEGKKPNKEEWKYIMAQNHLKWKYTNYERHRAIVNKRNPALKIVLDEYCGPLQSLGGALYNAEYLIYMLYNDYMFATVWDMGLMFDKMFGLVRTDEVNGTFRFIKRPNYYSLKMFTHHFGDLIVESKIINSPAFNAKGITNRFFKWPNETGIPSLTAIATIKGNRLYLMVINRELDKNITERISLLNFQPKKTAKLYVLNGPSIDSTNEKNPNTVIIKETTINNASNLFEYNFSKHSITVIELEKVTPNPATP